MKSFALGCLLVLVACSKESTPAGPLGSPMDFRSQLSAEARGRAPANDKAKRAELPADVHGVKAKLVWHTFEDGPQKYILSAEWMVETPAPGITLESRGALGMPTNAGTPNAANEQLIIGIRWHDHNKSGTSMGDATFEIRADGTGKQL